MSTSDSGSATGAPGPSLRDLLGLVPELVNADPVTLAVNLRERYGHVVRVPPVHPALDQPVYLVTHPDDVQYVLQSAPSKFGGLDVPGSRDFGEVVSDSVVSLTADGDGDEWLRRTRMVSPEFAERGMVGAVSRLAETTLATAAELSDGPGQRPHYPGVPPGARVRPADGDGVRLLPSMRRLSLRLLGVSLFGEDLRAHEVEVVDAVHRLRRQFKRRQLRVVGGRLSRHVPEELALPAWLGDRIGTGSVRLAGRRERATRDTIETLNAAAGAVVDRRTRTPRAFDDGPATWLTRPDPVTGETLDAETLRHEALGLFIAGHATTSAALTWAFYLLADRPETQARVRAEARDTPLLAPVADARASVGDDGSLPPVDGRVFLDSLPFTRRVWRETLRLYPALPLFGRTADADVTLGGVSVEAGSHVLLSPYVTHRDPAFWSAPATFDPDRFADAERHEFAYLPFSHGPHACLGRALATTEALVVLAATLATHRVEFVDDDPEPGVDTAINLQPDREIRLRFVPLED